MVEYPSEDEIVQLNREVLRAIRVKRADHHKVLSRAVIRGAIEAAEKDAGDVYHKAASLLMQLGQRHAFESGNRRTAFLAAMAFLALNGERPHLVHDAHVLLGIREGFYTKEQIVRWLKGRALPPFRR